MDLLIVDDDLVDRTHIRRTLKQSDASCNITEMEDVASALEILQHKQFDVILLDYNMPQRNGLELLHEVRSRNLEHGSAIIIISTSEDETLAMECLQAGAQDYIAKSDISADRLRRAIIHANARYKIETKLQESYFKVKQMAEQDELTKLANRYLFDETLKRAIVHNNNQQHRIALILFDLDHFKFVNDTHGHDVGDQLLQKAVNRISTCLRGRELFSRLGGDEFAIILTHLKTIDEAELVALRILRVLRKPFFINDAIIDISASIGIALYPDSAQDAIEIFKRADIAMYKAKNLGRNQVAFFEDEMQQQFLKRYKIENELKEVLANNALTLHYQPVYDGQSLNLIGFEALLRWPRENDPIYPDEFIPIAEECKLINPIGRWVIENALEKLSTWCAEYELKLSMAINLSPVQLADELLVPHIKSCISNLNINAQQIEFELTETALLVDSEKTKAIINEIAQLGCKIALDDFGTGFSSLSHLHHFPIDTVKIDKSLMPEAKQTAHKLLSGLVSMLHSLELSIVAEGIEYKSHLDLCRSLKIQRLQGYFLSRPLTINQVVELLKKQKSKI